MDTIPLSRSLADFVLSHLGYHQLCDDLSNVNMTAWVVNTKVCRQVRS